MKFYAMLNDDIIIKRSLKEAEEFALSYIDDDNIKYIEYGVIDRESWSGMSTIAILKDRLMSND